MAKDGFKLTPSVAAKLREAFTTFAAASKPVFTPVQLKHLADLSRSMANLSRSQIAPIEPPGEMISMDEIGDSIPAELAELRKLITELKTPAPAPSVAPSRGPQVDRVLRALRVLYPNPNDIEDTNPDVRRKVATYLQPETKAGLKVPDRRSMNRAIQLYRTR